MAEIWDGRETYISTPIRSALFRLALTAVALTLGYLALVLAGSAHEVYGLGGAWGKAGSIMMFLLGLVGFLVSLAASVAVWVVPWRKILGAITS